MDLFCVLRLLDVGATATGMVFPFQRTVVHCCTGNVLAPVAATVTMLRRTGVCMYVGAGLGAVVGWNA